MVTGYHDVCNVVTEIGPATKVVLARRDGFAADAWNRCYAVTGGDGCMRAGV